ncbi:MAG: hypothetical protein NUK57_01015 [Gudongella sp.]|nr:hypothetical protein [Gudongella sp.]
MSDIGKLKDKLLFETQKAFYDERGKGARYRMTLVGVEYIENELGEKAHDIEALAEWMKEKGFIEDIEITQDEFTFKASIRNCCLKGIRDSFDEKEMQPLSCPIGNMFMNAIEGENGLSPELMPIDIDGEYCGLNMAKFGSSDVVED